MNNIYIGYDPREDEAYQLAKYSIESRTTSDINVSALKLGELPFLTRPIEMKDGKMWCPISQAPVSTEFSISRFAVPFLQKDGWAIFMDCDIICLADIQELFDLADDRYAVMVVKHKQESGSDTKMGAQGLTQQVYYSRKNWSSVMLWNCNHLANEKLTIEHLNTWPGRDLHAFKWLEDSEIGELSVYWNYLIGVSPTAMKESIKIAHYTLGGPWIEGWTRQPSDTIWISEYISFKTVPITFN